MTDENIYRICSEPECGGTFYITPKDQKFFAARGLELPRRCFRCRKKNQAMAARQLGTEAETAPGGEYRKVWEEDQPKPADDYTDVWEERPKTPAPVPAARRPKKV